MKQLDQSMNNILSKAAKSVDSLLIKYREYLQIQNELQSLDHELMVSIAEVAKKNNKKVREVMTSTEGLAITQKISSRKVSLSQELKNISDSMTFENPIVWIMYKYLAYQGTSDAISTMVDFLNHCSKPGYICTKRFNFLNDYLKINRGIDLKDKRRFPDDIVLPELYESSLIVEVTEDEKFISDWHKHEYFKENGRIAKWEDYAS